MVGGAAGKFVDKALDAGGKWLTSYFENHHEKAKAKGAENAQEFLQNLAGRVAKLEREQRVSAEALAGASEHPDFSITLQKALLSAAQTDDKNKHDLLARLVAERIQAPPESMVSLASKLACEVISYLTPGQLMILGLATSIYHVAPSQRLSNVQVLPWLHRNIGPFMDARPTHLDYAHLESLSCIRIGSIGQDLYPILEGKFGEAISRDAFDETPLGKDLVRMWRDERLDVCVPTTVGQLLGVMVIDQHNGTKTSLDEWG